MTRLITLALLLVAACGTLRAEEFPVDRVLPKVVTLASPDQQYALYLPPGYSRDRKWPVLIMLDPRGRAETTLARVQEGARRHGWIVMSSYQSRSDTLESVTLFALQALLDESEKRFSTDRRRLYLAGMSGTAKTLWKVVKPLKGSLAGMIGCAGGYPPELPALSEAAPAFYGCTGSHDFKPVDGLLVASRTSDRGRSFTLLNEGLPTDLAYDLVYRHGMAVDETGEHVAFGSTTGGLWISDDGGDHWEAIPARLPPILAVSYA